MISVAEACEIIAANITRLPDEHVPLSAAVGRTLVQQVRAERDQPPFDRVTMDGAALCWPPTTSTRPIEGVQFAGDPPLALADRDNAIEIMTGAALGDTANTIVPVERYRVEASAGQRQLVLEPGYVPESGQFIHRRGSDHETGAVLLEPGMIIGGAELAIIASAGLERVRVARAPRIAVIATGNELVPAGRPIADHQIRLSNGPALVGALALAGYSAATLHHLTDEPAQLEVRLGELLTDNDVLILSGGVSKGQADHVPSVLTELGVEKHFHRVAQRPGKPMWFGTGRRSQLVFALPGNPVSTLACFRRYVVDALHVAGGRDVGRKPTARLAADWQFKPKLTALVPVVVRPDDDGQLWATPVTTNTSGDFSALGGSSGFVELPAAKDDFAAGESYPLYWWHGSTG
ncbi:MAG: molybdopterin molybdotransferase MoeA [Pseudomonadota bacterium]